VPGDLRVTAQWLQERELAHATQTVAVSRTGHFSLCGAPRERVVTLSVGIPGKVLATTTLTASATADVQPLEWRVNFQGLATNDVTLASIRGRIVQNGTGLPVVGADVWLTTVDRHARTDAQGAYRIDGVRPGALFLQVRKMNFSVQEDTLTVGAGTETVRNYTLSLEGGELDVDQRVRESGLGDDFTLHAPTRDDREGQMERFQGVEGRKTSAS
jgi:hypothetical protein